jgi:transglutaminase-like putative cysteine protease
VSLYPTGLRTTFHRIPLGVEGIKATMRIMRSMVQRWKLDPGVRALAKELTDSCPQGDYSCEVQSLHAFVRDRIRYVGDIADVETLQTPRATLEQASGDCDDKNTLLAALLEAVGHKSRFVAGAYQEQGFFEHVWLETRIGADWYPLETTRDVPAGWDPRARALPPCLVAHN